MAEPHSARVEARPVLPPPSRLDQLCSQLQASLVGSARSHAQNCPDLACDYDERWIGGYAEGIEHALEILRDGGPLARQLLSALAGEPVGWLAGFECEGRWNTQTHGGRLFATRRRAQQFVTSYNADGDPDDPDPNPSCVLEVRKVPE